jgi:carbamoyltransferase
LIEDREARATEIARLVADGRVVGLFSGRMEFGPRALGARSIIGDPRSPAMQSVMNLKIKYRESFRPFAPAVLAERAGDWFDIAVDSPYMMLVAQIAESLRSANGHGQPDDLREWVNEVRSEIPAVTHVDYSARLQTVDRDGNPEFHAILNAFDELTGCPVMINTSFNVRGEPIVCTPEDAFRCFMGNELDVLVVGNCMLQKSEQDPSLKLDYSEAFELD